MNLGTALNSKIIHQIVRLRLVIWLWFTFLCTIKAEQSVVISTLQASNRLSVSRVSRAKK